MRNSLKITYLSSIILVLLSSCSKDEKKIITPSNKYAGTSVLNGANEVFSHSNKTGSVTGTYDSGTKTLNITVVHVIGDGLVTDGHLHTGASTVNGAVSKLFTSSLNSPIQQTLTLTAQEETDLLAGNLYINLHSVAFPKGEIRGQLTASITAIAGTYNITAVLNGTNEVYSGSTKTGLLSIDYDSSTMILKLVITHNLGDGIATAAHIHSGASGTNGGVILPFIAPLNSITTQTFTLTHDQEMLLLAGNLYANFHTTAYPQGEIRGQLSVKANTATSNSSY